MLKSLVKHITPLVPGGTVMGWVVRSVNPTCAPELQHIELFDDGVWWTNMQVGRRRSPPPEGGVQVQS